MTINVDIVVLSRDGSPLRPEVEQGIRAQESSGVKTRLVRIVGRSRAEDPHRWATIARARNEGIAGSSAPWVMFLDDDVILAPGCARSLLDGLRRRPGHAALAADYLGESAAHSPWGRPDLHVAMGATLFRRQALGLVRFRWEPGRCECQCCCDDLRRLGQAIAYLPEATARHDLDAANPCREPRHGSASASSPRAAASPLPLALPRPGRVLAAFDRRHIERFRRQFLGSLRAAGNAEPVTAIGYGLYPSEQRALAWIPGLELVPLPTNGVLPPIRRLRDFQQVLARVPELTPVAYWDAGDVVFQGGLEPLWELVSAHPDKLLAVREPSSHPANPAVAAWTRSIDDPESRRRTFALLSSRPFLNSGFAAGTARSMLAYFREADHLLHSAALRGTSDWGDQTALNLYCHSDPERWHEVSEAWNYCVHGRQPGEVRIRPDGRIVSSRGTPIHAAHGNALSLPQLAISRRFG